MFTIDTASATLGVPEIDAELPKPEWLASGRFPQAIFESVRIRALDTTRYEVLGKLTLNGAVRERNGQRSSGATTGSAKAAGRTRRWWPTTCR